MYFTVTADGKPLRQRRYYFSEAFYAIANAEYYRQVYTPPCSLSMPFLSQKSAQTASSFSFEPPQTESESGVLPLHKSSKFGTVLL